MLKNTNQQKENMNKEEIGATHCDNCEKVIYESEFNLVNDYDVICDECKNKHESVSQNLILTGFKICKSCRISKTIFPI